MRKVLMFGANWCSPCRASKPVFNSLKETKPEYEYQIVDVDENHDLATKFDISSVPTFIVLENETVVDKIVGNVMKLKEIL